MKNNIQSNEELNSVLSGVAGEYFVAAELTVRGYIASITLRNTRGVDIVCTNSDASKSVAIQVKTNRRSDRNWILNQKVESYFADNFFYVFVNLNNNENSPDYFIVPSKDVAKEVRKDHQAWISAPGRGGAVHNDTPMRKFSDSNEKYLNQWSLLDL